MIFFPLRTRPLLQSVVLRVVEMNPGWSSSHMSVSCVCQGGVCCLPFLASLCQTGVNEGAKKIKQDPFLSCLLSLSLLPFTVNTFFFLSLIRSPSLSLTPVHDVTSALFICSAYWNKTDNEDN